MKYTNCLQEYQLLLALKQLQVVITEWEID